MFDYNSFSQWINSSLLYGGGTNFSSIKDVPFFSLPSITFIDYNLSFNISTILTMVVIYIVLLLETTGTWYQVSSVKDQPITDEQINKGVIGRRLGCLVAELVGATSVTGY